MDNCECGGITKYNWKEESIMCRRCGKVIKHIPLKPKNKNVWRWHTRDNWDGLNLWFLCKEVSFDVR